MKEVVVSEEDKESCMKWEVNEEGRWEGEIVDEGMSSRFVIQLSILVEFIGSV